jgi:hypothetical protein
VLHLVGSLIVVYGHMSWFFLISNLILLFIKKHKGAQPKYIGRIHERHSLREEKKKKKKKKNTNSEIQEN